MRAASHRVRRRLPWSSKMAEITRVPVWVRMEKYKAMARAGWFRTAYGGGRSSASALEVARGQDVRMNHHNVRAVSRRPRARRTRTLATITTAVGSTPLVRRRSILALGDAGIYRCDICNEYCYRDDFGIRWNRSATIMDGGLVCRDCEVHGLIAPREAREQMDRAHKLASFIGGDTLRSYERGMEMFEQKTRGDYPCQTRLYKEDMYSFGWSTLVLDDDGKWRPWIHGGFIKHGPEAKPADGGGYDFTAWDYGKKCVRPATAEEINHIHWSSHT